MVWSLGSHKARIRHPGAFSNKVEFGSIVPRHTPLCEQLFTVEFVQLLLGDRYPSGPQLCGTSNGGYSPHDAPH